MNQKAMRIISAASAFPTNYYPQEVLLDALERYWGAELKNPDALRRLHKNTGVQWRHLALPVEAYLEISRWGEFNNTWIATAVELGKQAICRGLSCAGLTPTDLSAIFFTSVTGISSPSIDALLVNRMGLSPNIRRVPMFGLGCVAGAAGVARAADYVRAYPSQIAVLLSVELCSLTIQKKDLSTANLISSGLFGDGAAAVIVAGDEYIAKSGNERLGPKIIGTRSVFYPETEEMMGWDISERGFQIVLSREVPDLIRKRLGGDVNDFLSEYDLNRSDIKSWVLHTGGTRILEAIEGALDLHNGELQASWDCLAKRGNLSSASVLVTLEEVMKNRRPEPGTLGMMAAMGPGFCSELLLLQW